MGRKTSNWSSSHQGWGGPHTGTSTLCPPSPAPGREGPLRSHNEEGDKETLRESTETGRYKVEQSGLSVFVDVHHKDCEEETGKIS